MSISFPYQDAIRRRLVIDFVKENRRSPTEAELKDLLRIQFEKYATIDNVGFAGFEMVRPGYTDYSSANEENINRAALADDHRVLRERIESLSDILESSFRGFTATATRCSRALDQLERRADTLLLLNGNSDVFVNGIEEAFKTHQHVDFGFTTASVEDGYATLGRKGYSTLDLSTAKFRYTVMAPKGILSKRNTSDITSLREDDGNIWDYLVYTDYEQGKVSLIIEISLQDPSYVGDLKLGIAPLSVNKKMTASLFYSVDGQAFSLLEPAETVITSDSLVFNVGIDGIKKLQVLLTKEAYDSKTPNKKQNVYAFSLDSLKIFTDLYQDDSHSVLICGPYEVISAEGSPVYFSKATLSACTYEPDETSIDFYLSNDGENWKFSAHDGKSLQLVTFGDSTSTVSAAYIDPSETAQTVLEEAEGIDEVDFQSEGILNIYISPDYEGQVPLQSIVIKRNIVGTDEDTLLLGATPGWSLDERTRRYTTTVYVSAAEGRTIDFGPKSIIVNGTNLSGQVFLRQGYSVLGVSDVNWVTVQTGITDVASLKFADPLYPYNHKLLIEGYPYPGAFTGEKVYTGVEEYFGVKLSYMAPDLFSYLQPSDKNYYTVFTIEELDGAIYFKVKVNKKDSTWSEELYEADWTIQNSDTNQLWVKAIMSSSADGKTPRIENFRVQVI